MLSIEILTSIAAITLSLSNWVYTFFKDRKNVSIIIDRYTSYLADDDCEVAVVLASVVLENKSRQPVAISKISAMSLDCNFEFDVGKQVIFNGSDYVGEVIKNESEICSTQFPVNLFPMTSEHAYICAQIYKDALQFDATASTFVIHTNRGAVKQKIQRLRERRVDKNAFLSADYR